MKAECSSPSYFNTNFQAARGLIPILPTSKWARRNRSSHASNSPNVQGSRVLNSIIKPHFFMMQILWQLKFPLTSPQGVRFLQLPPHQCFLQNWSQTPAWLLQLAADMGKALAAGSGSLGVPQPASFHLLFSTVLFCPHMAPFPDFFLPWMQKATHNI